MHYRWKFFVYFIFLVLDFCAKEHAILRISSKTQNTMCNVYLNFTHNNLHAQNTLITFWEIYAITFN